VFVSVIVPAFNADRFLRASLESVLNQTHQDFELIVVNDGSTDNTLAIARQFEELDPRVRVIDHENWGMGASLNDAIEKSCGEWIARLDADDLMVPHRLERQISFVSNHPDIAVTASLVIYIDDHGNELGRSQSDIVHPGSAENKRESGALIDLHHPAVLMKRDVIRSIGGYRPEYWPCDDLELWNRVVDAGQKVMVQPEYLVRYRIHNHAATVSSSSETRLKLNWLEYSANCRRRGLQELSFDDFQQCRRELPLLTRVNERRKELAFGLYKQATFHYSVGRNMKAVVWAILASFLEPTYAPRQVWRKLIQPRISTAKVRSR
jgi:glycosyltransferase involved in cell wall biosynthesis